MTIYQKIGITLIVLGIVMFFLGASLFTYQGPPLNPIVSGLGLYSFLLWLPAIILGLILIFIRKRKV